MGPWKILLNPGMSGMVGTDKKENSLVPGEFPAFSGGILSDGMIEWQRLKYLHKEAHTWKGKQ